MSFKYLSFLILLISIFVFICPLKAEMAQPDKEKLVQGLLTGNLNIRLPAISVLKASSSADKISIFHLLSQKMQAMGRDAEGVWIKKCYAIDAMVIIASTTQVSLRPIADQLGQQDSRIRDCASRALTQVGALAVPALIHLFEDENPDIRREAVRALEQIKTADSKAALESYRQTGKTDVVRLKANTISELIKELQNNSRGVRAQAADRLGAFGPAAAKAVGPLTNALIDPDMDVRSSAAMALGNIGSAAIRPIMQFMNGPEGNMQLLVKYGPEHKRTNLLVETFAMIGKPCVPTLIQEIESKGRLHSVAIEALGRIGPDAKEAIPVLAKFLSSRHDFSNATRALAGIGAPAVPTLRKMMKTHDFDLRISVDVALREMGPPAKEAVPDLLEWLKDNDYRVRNMAAETLGNIGPDAAEAVPALTKALDDKELIVCETAERALHKINPSPQYAPAPEFITKEVGGKKVVMSKKLTASTQRQRIPPRVSVCQKRKEQLRHSPQEKVKAEQWMKDFERDYQPFKGPYPPLASIQVEEDGQKFAISGYRGLVEILVDAQVSKEDVSRAVRSVQGKIVYAMPQVGIYWIEVPAKTEGNAIKRLKQKNWEAHPVIPIEPK